MLNSAMCRRWPVIVLLLLLCVGCSSPIETLRAELRSSHPEQRRRALFAVGHRRESLVLEEVVQLLHHDPLVYLRKKAAATLGLLGDRRALAPLRRALTGDPAALVREEAAYALAALGGPEVVSVLQQAWHREQDRTVRRGIATALRRLGIAVDD